MSTLELLLTGVGLSMDAFAVAICQGLCMPKINWRNAAVIALFFGGFQALMPFLGWMLGSQFAGQIQSIDHWVAFVLLGLIGANMIREALGPEEAADSTVTLSLRRLLVLSVATSIDALAVGVTFAFLEVLILPAIAIIGCTTFCLSLAGVAAGNFFGARYKKRAELSGGIILILLGVKILLEHLGILG
ncbi:MAG: manganese efflux pump [Oscillibacter sp.]|nr:manganese efflux pump [Oscillibacter sp.]